MRPHVITGRAALTVLRRRRKVATRGMAVILFAVSFCVLCGELEKDGYTYRDPLTN